MPTRLSAIRLMAALAVAWGGHGGPARADDFQPLDDPAHLDEMTAAVQRSANSLCWEMHRHHRQQADFSTVYRDAKAVWEMSGSLRDALRTGEIDPATLNDRLTKLSETFARVETGTVAWGDGMRPPLGPVPPEGEAVVVPGPVDIEIPLLFGGIRVGSRPRVVVTEPAFPGPPRRALHPNGHGSRRALEREMFSVRSGLNDLLEDAGIAPPAREQAEPKTAPPAAQDSGPLLAPPTKIVPRSANRAPSKTSD